MQVQPLLIEGVIEDHEQPMLIAAAEQLSDQLGEPGGPGWPVRLRTRTADEPFEPLPGAAVVVSMLGEVARAQEPFARTAMRWRALFDQLAEKASGQVMICTLFHHAAPDRRPVLERLRRLNLMAVELSHATGAGVIDIDRAFTLLGAQALQSDFRITGPRAVQAAGDVIARALLDSRWEAIVSRTGRRPAGTSTALPDLDLLMERRLQRPT